MTSWEPKMEWDEELRDTFKDNLLHFHGEPGTRVEKTGRFPAADYLTKGESLFRFRPLPRSPPAEAGPLPPRAGSFKSSPLPTSCAQASTAAVRPALLQGTQAPHTSLCPAVVAQDG